MANKKGTHCGILPMLIRAGACLHEQYLRQTSEQRSASLP